MPRYASRGRKTDYGTVILHFCIVTALVVAVLSGLRIATETPGRTWINTLDFILPHHLVWTTHIKAAVAIIAIAIAYPVYIVRGGLSRRIRVDRVRLAGFFGSRHARWNAINVTFYWAFYLTLLSEIATGTLMYFDYADHFVITVHWFGIWLILGYFILHVLTQWVIGGAPQLSRILRPTRLPPQLPPFDPIDLLDLLDQPASGPNEFREPRVGTLQPVLDRTVAPLSPTSTDAQSHWPLKSTTNPKPGAAQPRRSTYDNQRGSVLQSNPFVVAISVAVAVSSLMIMGDRQTTTSLLIRRVSASDVPVIDGDMSDRVWRMAEPIYIVTDHGANFDGKGETTVEIRAVHDSNRVYFLFLWDDPTRSLKQLPLIKTAEGWRLLHKGYESGDEQAYNEDKFAVLFTLLDVTLAGDRTFHAGDKPLNREPRTLSGRGLHYTEKLGLYADVWEWKATSTNAAGFMDDDHFGPPIEATRSQVEGVVPYHGGFAHDPGSASYANNFAPHSPKGYSGIVLPRRLPADLSAMRNAMGTIDLDPNRGEGEGVRWYMTEAESIPYSRDRDATIPIGTVVPGVVVSDTYSGDRADVRCAARWAAGRWALEIERRLDTGSPYDIVIRTGTFMRVAAFDHAQIAHTRHVRPIRLEVE